MVPEIFSTSLHSLFTCIVKDEKSSCNKNVFMIIKVISFLVEYISNLSDVEKMESMQYFHFYIQRYHRYTFESSFQAMIRYLILHLFSNIKNTSDMNTTEDDDDDDNDDMENNKIDSESTAIQERINIESELILKSLVTLHMLEFYENSIMKAFRDVIDQHTVKHLHKSYDAAYLPSCKSWFDNILMIALPTVFSVDTVDKTKSRVKLLWKYVTNSIFRIRTNEMFEIIQEFPSSLPAILELKSTSANSLAQIGKVFRKVIQNRLLHPGASTTQILDIYILMIRSFRVLDPSDSILNYVATPIRAYLKQRKDTVHRIVSSLSEGRDSDLHMELKKGESLEYGQDEDYEEPICAENWQPRQRHPELQDTCFSGLDVLALLVSIYGSTDVFVKEYRSQLGSKLLANQNYSIDEDMATLEHLKKRFGEEPLHSCEVMLHDLEESRRTNVSVSSHYKQTLSTTSTTTTSTGTVSLSNSSSYVTDGIPSDFTIISDNYWPQLPQLEDPSNMDTFVLHPVAAELLEEYQKSYTELKKPRKLNVFQHYGQVLLELAFDTGSSKIFSVSPLQASLILHVGDHSQISSTELGQLVQVPEDEVRRKMHFWSRMGVVIELSSGSTINSSSGTGDSSSRLISPRAHSTESVMYRSVDSPHEGAFKLGSVLNEMEIVSEQQFEDEDSMASGSMNEESHSKEYLDTLEKYVIGLLSNQEPMTHERLHTMLTLLSSGGGSSQDIKFEMNFVDLQKFLQSLAASEKIYCIDGLYSGLNSRMTRK